MGENGFLPFSLFGLRKDWDNKKAFVTDSYGQEWVRVRHECIFYNLYLANNVWLPVHSSMV